jgi:hypothetical protein
MNKIYVVIESWGEYEDAGEELIKGYLDHAKAEYAILMLKEADRAYWEIRDKFAVMFSTISVAVRPPPRPDLLLQPKQPKGLKKDLWPQTYWDEKERVEMYNKAVHFEYEAKLQVYFEDLGKAATKVFDALNVPVEERNHYASAPYYVYDYSRRRDNSYRVEELEVE